MRSSLSTRLRVLLCLAAGVPVALAMGASSASAVVSKQCSGENITGQGANVMAVAYQNVFDPEFNNELNTNKTACSGSQGDKKKPTVNYTSSSSGIGLESWGATGGTGSFGIGNAFVVTEEPPNPEERGKIEANETTPGSAPESVLTIPVAQESIAILVHLPTGCTATSTLFPGRLVIGNVALQEIFLGTLKTWTSIKDGGDTFIGSTCASTITPIVRLDSAGSTHILKKYLNLINANKFPVESLSEEETWNDISEGTANTLWPVAAAVKRPAKKGDTEEVAAVASTASSIGYASLANARKNLAFQPPPAGTGGKETSVFWAPIQNSGVKTTKETFADPSSDAESSEVADANCAKEKYTNGKGVKFPPVSTQDTWQEVTTETKQKNYPLCGIAYQLALTKYSAYPLTTEGEELTVANFLSFALEAKAVGGGQKLLEKHDYEALPSSLDGESLKGVKLIHF